MIEEAEFHRTLESVNETPCPFEKAVLNSGFGCSCSLRMWLADRESASCTCPTAQARCVLTLQALRLEAAEILGGNITVQRFPHNQELRLQTGGLLGIQAALAAAPATLRVADITALTQQAQAQWGDWTQWPYPEILTHIAAQQTVRRSRR